MTKSNPPAPLAQDDTRYSFDVAGNELPFNTHTATPIEIAAQFAAIDRTHVHRRSSDMAPPTCRIDRNEATRIIVRAAAMERNSYKHRARYQHRGVLGDLSISLLQALMNFGRKYGQIFPSYETLAYMLRKGTEAVVEAMKRLIQHGFVTKHRRSKLIGTPQGDRRVQDSNAYEVHMPDHGLAKLVIIAGPASGSDNPDVSSIQNRNLKDSVTSASDKDRFWLEQPWRMANGSYY